MHSNNPSMQYTKNSNSSLACNSKNLWEPTKSRSKLLNRLEYLSQEKRLRAGILQPAEEKTQGNLTTVYKYWWRGVKKTEPDSSQWYPVNRQQAMVANWNTGKTCFPLRVAEHCTIAQGGCLKTWHSKPNWKRSQATYSSWLLFEQGGWLN